MSEQTPDAPLSNQNQLAPQILNESVPALLGIRRFIIARRLGRAADVLLEREATDEVQRAAPEGARLVRTFGTEPEDPAVAPINFVERRTSLHRQSQVSKLRKSGREIWRINEVYGEKQPLVPRPQREDFVTVDAFRAALGAWTVASDDLPLTNDVGTFEHLQRLNGDVGVRQRIPHHQRRSERKAVKHLAKQEGVIGTLDDRLDRGAAGQTLPGRVRTVLTDRALENYADLNDHLGELDRLLEIRTAQRLMRVPLWQRVAARLRHR